MSKHKSNVHPDHYKTAGREAQGRDVIQTINRQAYTETIAKQKTANSWDPAGKGETRTGGPKNKAGSSLVTSAGAETGGKDMPVDRNDSSSPRPSSPQVAAKPDRKSKPLAVRVATAAGSSLGRVAAQGTKLKRLPLKHGTSGTEQSGQLLNAKGTKATSKPKNASGKHRTEKKRR